MTKVAIVHDYLTQRGGAERVVLDMARAFPEAPIYTSLYSPEATFPEFLDLDVRPCAMNHVAWLRADHRRALPLLATAFSTTRVDAEVTLVSTSGWAHGVKTSGKKLVYCHNPPRWLHQPNEYLNEAPAYLRASLRGLSPALKRWDRRAALSADRYLANSTTVAKRILDTYGIASEVLFPPHAANIDGRMASMPGAEPGYYLVVSRLLPYKHVSVIVEAFRQLPDQRLIVVGEGPEKSSIAAAASSNVRLVGAVSDEVLRFLYSRTAGLISASFEDFGLTPLEANAFGKPAILLRHGGFLDTGLSKVSCIFFDLPQVDHILAAVRQAIGMPWSEARLRAHAEGFSSGAFQEGIIDKVAAMTPGIALTVQ